MPQAVLLDDLQSFFTDYAQAFRRRDAAALIRFVELPLTRVTSARQTFLEDEEAAEDSIEQLVALFEANGIANGRIATIEVGTAMDDSVEVNVHWELLNDDDEPVIGYDVVYTLVRAGEHKWRISMIQEDEQNRAFLDAGWTERNAA